MKIQYLSDLHMELMSPNKFNKLCDKIVPKCDVLVLAGDIGNPLHQDEKYKIFLHSTSEKFKKIFLVSGNHEYYGNDINKTNEEIESICGSISNVSFLNNSTELYNVYRFIGTTQWTHITDSRYLINDFYAIKEMNVNRYNNLHEVARLFLKKSIEKSCEDNEKVVVITHHLPFHKLTHQKYLTNFANYNHCFSAELHDVICHPNTIQSWFYGHTHTASAQKILDIQYYCNPLGYDGEDNKPDFNRVVDVKLALPT